MATAPTAGIPIQAGQRVTVPRQAQNVQPGRGPSPSAPTRQQEKAAAPGTAIASADVKERALVPATTPVENTHLDLSASAFAAPVTRLPVELDVSISLRDFRVRDLLALEPGGLIESAWSGGADLPLAAGAVQLAWADFEVVETDLVVRLTRLA